jgi:phage tail-like protein
MPRSTPYGAFNFTVNLNSPDASMDPGAELGGFSDVSGLVTEMTVAEYRNGNAKDKHVKKVPLLHKVGDVTLKRGIVDSKEFFAWIKSTRDTGYAAKRDVVVTLLGDDGKEAVRKWILQGVIPLKYTGPTLAGKGGDVAMEELVLSCEGLTVE